MAINPLLVSIKQASDLTTAIPTAAGYFFYYEGGDLRKASMTDIYNKVNGAFGGDLLIVDNPAPTTPTWYFAKESGTYANAGGLVVDTDGKFVILNYDGAAWSMIETASLEGKSAYQIALDNGFVGTEPEWLASLQGIGVTDYITTFENLIDPNQTTQSGYFEGTGVTPLNPGDKAGSQVIPTAIGAKYWIKNIFTIQFLDASMNVMSSAYASSYTVDGILTIPAYTGSGSLAGVAGMKVSTREGATAFADGLVGLGLGDVAPISMPAYGEDYAEPKEGLMAGIQDALVLPTPDVQDIHMIEFDNLINPSQTTQQGVYSGYGIIDIGTDFRVGLDYIPAKVGDKFWFRSLANVQFADASKTTIYADAIDTYSTDGIFTVPPMVGAVSLAPTAFIRVGSGSGPNAFSSGLSAMGMGDVFPAEIPQYDSEYVEPDEALSSGIAAKIMKDTSPLKGKTVYLTSDSIGNHPQSMIVQLCAKHGATMTKVSQDGAWISHPNPNPDPTNIKFFLSEEYLNLPSTDPDIVLIAAATNDINITGWETRLGTMDDRTNDTFYGALHVLISGLRARYLDARIGFIAPIPSSIRYIEGDLTNLPYVKFKAIKEVCAYYSIPVWNGNTEYGGSPLDSTAWRAKYQDDLTHPTVIGHTWYMNRVEDFVLNLAK